MKGIKRIILLLTVVTIVTAGVTKLTVYNIDKDSGAREGKHTYEDQPAQNEPVVLAQGCTEEAPCLEYTEEELGVLAIIVYQEAGGDAYSDDTRRKVGSVFLNRVASPRFPNTFEEVATQNRQYGTLYKTGLKWPKRAALPEEAHAVERAYRIAEELLLGGSILPPNVIWQAEFKQGDGIYCHQDDIYFCYSEVSK